MKKQHYITKTLLFATLLLGSAVAQALHIDVVVGRLGNKLTANFCDLGSPGCDSLDALAVVGVPSGTIPVHEVTGEQIFVTDFGDFAGGPFGVDDPGFFANANALPADSLLSYQGLGTLQYWNKNTSSWSNNTPNNERVRLSGGLDVTVIEDSSSCDGLLICIPDTSLEFNESNTLFTANGIIGKSSLIIDNTQSDGSLHTHLDWFIEDSNGNLGGSEGAYLVQLAMRMDGLVNSDPFLILFNRGLNTTEFAAALLALMQSSDGSSLVDDAFFGPPTDLSVVDHVGGALDVPASNLFELETSASAPGSPYALRVNALSGSGSIDLGENQMLAELAADASFGGIVFGNGDLILRADSADTLTVSGLLGQSGWTSIESGSLALDNSGDISSTSRVFVGTDGALDIAGANGPRTIGALNGSGSVELGANTLRIGDGALLAEFSGTIAGTGGITKIGDGEQRLLGLGTFSGETRVESGRLTVVPDAISNNVFTASDLHFRIDADDTYAGSVTGPGRISKSGSGRLLLSGMHNHSGGTFVQGGTLALEATTLSGPIQNNAVLHFEQNVDGVFGGNISGTGQLLKSGPGILRLSGTNTYSGGTTISGPFALTSDANLGALSGNLTLNTAEFHALAPLNIQRSVIFSGMNTLDTGNNHVEISGFISGAGSLTKFGSGTLTLSGGSNATGNTKIMEGILRLRGRAGGNLFLASGTRLRGSGEIGGDLELASGSIYDVTLAPGFADTLNVLGHAKIGGSTLRLDALSGDYPVRSLFPLITAGKGVSGTFAQVSSNLAFLIPRLDYDNNHVFLHLTRNDKTFADFAVDSNQTSAAHALEAMLNEPHGDAMVVVQGLQTLATNEVPAAIQAMSGASAIPVPSANQAQSRAVVRQVSTRLRGLSVSSSLSMDGRTNDQVLIAAVDGTAQGDNQVLGSAMQAASTLSKDYTHGVWVRAVAGFGDFDLSGNTSADTDNAGVIFGYDVQIAKTLTAGLFGLYYDAEVNQDGPDATTAITGWQGGAYARVEVENWYADFVGSYGFDEYASQRSLFIGSLNRLANADFDGESANLYGEIGYATRGKITLEPFFGLGWSSNWRNSYAETGAGALGLQVDEETTDSLRSVLGMRARFGFLAFGARESIVEFRGAWAHEFDDPSAFTASFLGDASNTRFRISADDSVTDSAVLGTSVVARLGTRAEAFVDFNAEIDKRQNFWSFGTGVRVTW